MHIPFKNSFLVIAAIGCISSVAARTIPPTAPARSRDVQCGGEPCSVKSTSGITPRWDSTADHGSIKPRIEFLSGPHEGGGPHEEGPHNSPIDGSPGESPTEGGSSSEGGSGSDTRPHAGSSGGSGGAALSRPLGVPEDPPAILKDAFVRYLEEISPEGGHPLGKDMSVFNSGGDEPFESANTFAEKNHLKDYGATFEDVDTEVDSTDEGVEEFNIKLLSAAFARASSGEARVFFPKGGLTSDTVFTSVEWPELVSNGQVTKVTWIDPEDEASTEVIWQTGGGDGAFPLNTAPKDVRH